MNIQNNKAFTLVELIVVITILAILGTIAFISLQGYSQSARDSKRISDIQNIKKSLELFTLNTSKYPLPDNGNQALYDDELIWTQGTVGDIVTSNLSRNLKEKPLDPLTETEYIYSTTQSQKEYEVLSIYESDIVSYDNLLNQAKAETIYPKIDGTYNQIYVVTPRYIIPTPSIINVEMVSTGIILNDTNIQSQIITGGSNMIDYGTITSSTGGLADFKLDAYTGGLSTLDTSTGKLLLVESLQTAYSGSLLAEEDIYQPIILASTDDEKKALVSEVVLHDIPKIITSVNCIADSTYTINSHDYNVEQLNHDASSTPTVDVGENNGIFRYTFNALCNNGTITGSETGPVVQSCNTGYGISGNACTVVNKIIFVTSTKYDGNLGGISGADSICQNTAVSAGLPGTYKAWIAIGPSDDPKTSFSKSTNPYINVNGDPLSTSYDSIWVNQTGALLNPLTYQDGLPLVGEYLWSNVAQQNSYNEYVGRYGNVTSCQNWTSSLSTDSSAGGYSKNTSNFMWQGGYGDTCDTLRSLLCWQQ